MISPHPIEDNVGEWESFQLYSRHKMSFGKRSKLKVPIVKGSSQSGTRIGSKVEHDIFEEEALEALKSEKWSRDYCDFQAKSLVLISIYNLFQSKSKV